VHEETAMRSMLRAFAFGLTGAFAPRGYLFATGQAMLPGQWPALNRRGKVA